MKKLILIIAIMFIGIFAYPSEWINVNGKDYKVCKIDTINQVVITSGWYDVVEKEGEYYPEYKGGLGNYFFYNLERKDAITLTDDKVRKIIDLIYPKKETLN